MPQQPELIYNFLRKQWPLLFCDCCLAQQTAVTKGETNTIARTLAYSGHNLIGSRECVQSAALKARLSRRHFSVARKLTGALRSQGPCHLDFDGCLGNPLGSNPREIVISRGPL